MARQRTGDWLRRQHAPSMCADGSTTVAGWTVSKTKLVRTWVRVGDRNISTRIDLPPGDSIGFVVIVPPCGRELDVAYRTVRILANHAARAGFIACLPDLTGHGDSQGLGDYDDVAETWVQDVEALISETKRIAPELPIHLIGVRLGAAVAAQVRQEVTSKILWEPINGKRFVRQQRALRNLVIPDALKQESGFEDFAGLLLTRVQAKSLNRLGDVDPARSPDITVRFEEDRKVAFSLIAAAPEHARVPLQAIDAIIATLPKSARGRYLTWPTVESARLRLPSGEIVQETNRRIGPNGLMAIETQPIDTAPKDIGIVFTATGVEVRSGAGGVWADAARAAASTGIRSLRVDRRRIGDMIDCDSVEPPIAYTQEAITDVIHAVKELQGLGVARVGVVGACAGAWLALKASQQVRLDFIFSVNALYWKQKPLATNPSLVNADTGHRHARLLNSNLAVPTPQDSGPADTGPAVSIPRLARFFPSKLRRALFLDPSLEEPPSRISLGIGLPVLWGVPKSTRLHFVFGQEEAGIFRMLGGSLFVLIQRLRKRQLILTEVKNMQHSMLSKRSRDIVCQNLFQIAHAPEIASRYRNGHPILPLGPTEKQQSA